MGWLADRKRRADPQGAGLADGLSAAINALGWPQVAWLIEDGEDHEVTVDSAAGPRLVQVHARWDMDPWLSDSIVRIKVQAIVGGKPRGVHKGFATHPGERLPAIPRAAVPVDLVALAEGFIG